MPKFIYTAKSYDGQTKGGESISQDEKTLAQQLRADGFFITSVKKIEEESARSSRILSGFFGRVPLKEKVMFTRNLGVMVASGVNITKALKNMSVQSKNKTFQKALLDMSNQLESGKTLSECMDAYPAIFSRLYVNMVKVGEAAGNLEEVLKIVANHLEKEYELMSKVRGAMIYPAVIVFAMIIVGILMLTYILPKITGVFKDMNVELPVTTKFIIAVSDFLRGHIYVAPLVMVGAFVALKIFLQTSAGNKTMSFLTIKIPLFRNMTIMINCARFARIHSSLLRSGVSVIESLKIISETLTNYYYHRELKKSISEVQKGINLSKVTAQSPQIFPPLITQMLEVGEETGQTEAVLMKMAEFYEEEVSTMTKNLSSIIEPVLMLVIGTAVGFFAVSMLQPMYSVLENIK